MAGPANLSAVFFLLGIMRTPLVSLHQVIDVLMMKLIKAKRGLDFVRDFLPLPSVFLLINEMTTRTQWVPVDGAHIKQQLKARKITGQIIMSLSGSKEIGVVSFNKMMREGRVKASVAGVFDRLGIDY